MKRFLLSLLALTLFISGCTGGTVSVQPSASAVTIASEEPQQEERSEEWFVGDWAGLITGYGKIPGSTDFGMATLNYCDGQCCLFRIYATGTGYEAAFGSSLWDVTEHSKEGIIITCKRASQDYEIHPDSFKEGQTITFAYSEEAKSSVAGAMVPEKHILFGEASDRGAYHLNYHLILALLPPGNQRSDDSGVYPCWYGGYENMDGDFHGMFCLGINGRGKRMFGQVLARSDGIETVMGLHDGVDYDRTFLYGQRDMRENDLTRLVGLDDADGEFFAQFYRYDAEGLSSWWTNVSIEHKHYYETVYIPQLENELAELRASDQNVWIQRQILVKRGFLSYAQKIVNGELDGIRELIPYIPQMVQLDPAYRSAVSLARIKPGDTIEDAKRQYDLHELQASEWARFGISSIYCVKEKFYTDGAGLLLKTYPENGIDRIEKVELYQPGYDTPDGRQVGDVFNRSKALLYATDAMLQFGDVSLQDGVDPIDVISMTIVSDRIWDETDLDVDGDGELEHLTLSGRCHGSYVEQGTMLGNSETGIADEMDFGTRATLRVYKEDALYIEAELPLYIFYLQPEFCDKLQTDEPGKVWIICPTGGTGLEEPIHCIKFDGNEFKTEFLGFIDIYA